MTLEIQLNWTNIKCVDWNFCYKIQNLIRIFNGQWLILMDENCKCEKSQNLIVCNWIYSINLINCWKKSFKQSFGLVFVDILNWRKDAWHKFCMNCCT